jgi:hypothetical protein
MLFKTIFARITPYSFPNPTAQFISIIPFPISYFKYYSFNILFDSYNLK